MCVPKPSGFPFRLLASHWSTPLLCVRAIGGGGVSGQRGRLNVATTFQSLKASRREGAGESEVWIGSATRWTCDTVGGGETVVDRSSSVAELHAGRPDRCAASSRFLPPSPNLTNCFQNLQLGHLWDLRTD